MKNAYCKGTSCKKQIAKNGLMTSMLKISDGALKRIIYAYTRKRESVNWKDR